MDYIQELKQDIRFIEGFNNCINCGTCTATCPAAAVMDYDPREIMDIVQQNDNLQIEVLLQSDKIWYCGECLSCKTRCPRDNSPCYVIQSLRYLSIVSGLYKQSREGQKQIELKHKIIDQILKTGYCIHIDDINLAEHPEHSPLIDYLRIDKIKKIKIAGSSYLENIKGGLRAIPKESIKELQAIFDATGATNYITLEKVTSNE